MERDSMSVESMALRIEYERQEAEDRANRLHRALLEAIDELEDMVGYVPEYFREKWDYDATILRLRKALA
jgi:hypothetical protein